MTDIVQQLEELAALRKLAESPTDWSDGITKQANYVAAALQFDFTYLAAEVKRLREENAGLVDIRQRATSLLEQLAFVELPTSQSAKQLRYMARELECAIEPPSEDECLLMGEQGLAKLAGAEQEDSE